MLFTRSRSRLIASLLMFCVACCFSSVTARADLPRPRPTPEPKPAPDKPDQKQLLLSTDGNAKEAHLRIPASALKPGAQPGSQPHSDSGISPMRTVIAGIALTAAITMSGLLLVRGRGRRRVLLLAGLAAGAGVLGSIASADIARPRPRPPEKSESVLVIPASGLNMPVVIDIVDDGPIQLTIPGSVTGKAPAK